ncbi:hypothetical protein KR044_007928 [Drosophila immigrans]|nr:hypothetical protein KR044_007928 [Drosophila immigrans]
MRYLRSEVCRAQFNPMNAAATIDSTTATLEQVERRSEHLKQQLCILNDKMLALQQTVNKSFCDNMNAAKSGSNRTITMTKKCARVWKKRLSNLLIQDTRMRS